MRILANLPLISLPVKVSFCDSGHQCLGNLWWIGLKRREERSVFLLFSYLSFFLSLSIICRNCTAYHPPHTECAHWSHLRGGGGWDLWRILSSAENKNQMCFCFILIYWASYWVCNEMSLGKWLPRSWLLQIWKSVFGIVLFWSGMWSDHVFTKLGPLSSWRENEDQCCWKLLHVTCHCQVLSLWAEWKGHRNQDYWGQLWKVAQWSCIMSALMNDMDLTDERAFCDEWVNG